MRTVLPLLLLPLLSSGLALAQVDAPPPDLPTAGSAASPGTVLLDDRDAAAVPAALQDESSPPPPAEPPLPEKILEPPPPEAAPTVSIRSDGDDVVEEYRQNGKIYMVKVRPTRGVPYTLMDSNGDGRLDSHDSDAPVAPVYYTLYEWN